MKSKAKENIMSFQERENILNSITNREEELVVKGLLFTGLRISEFLHMNRDWIDFKEGIIHIPYRIPCKCSKSCKEGNYKYYKIDRKTNEKTKLETPELTKPINTWQCKTKQAERPIPILPEVENVFKEYFKIHKNIMDTIGNRVYVWRLLRDIGIRAKISKKAFPHMMRSTFATTLVEKGLEDPIALTQIMGWANYTQAQSYITLQGSTLKKKVMNIWGNK